jgi:hypothetical protein
MKSKYPVNLMLEDEITKKKGQKKPPKSTKQTHDPRGKTKKTS